MSIGLVADLSVTEADERLKPSVAELRRSLTVTWPAPPEVSVAARVSLSGVGDLPREERLGFLLVSEGFCDACRLSAMVLFKDRLMPGKPSLVSCRGAGVAVGSIDTAERTGNTRSMEPGLITAAWLSFLD